VGESSGVFAQRRDQGGGLMSSGGQITLQGWVAKVAAAIVASALLAGAGGAVGTYSLAIELRSDLRALGERVAKLEHAADASKDGSATTLRAIEGRLSAIEAKLAMLIEDRR
jgi:hypothetical protein